MKKFVLFKAFIFLFVLASQGQTAVEISGTVRDGRGASVAGARVVLSGAVERSAVTGADGSFAFKDVPRGVYELRVSAEGFDVIAKKIELVGQSRNVEIVLEIAETRFTVTAEIGREIERTAVPQAVSLISREELFARRSSVLAEAGEEEAGLNVQKTSPTIGAIVVRGLTGKNVVHYIDGVRYTTSAQRGGINTFFNLNDESNLESIEVLRGPNSAQYGSDSLGGTVNLLSRAGIFGAEKPEFRGETGAFFRSADRSAGGSAFLNYGTQKLGGYVNLYGRRVGTLRSAAGLDSHSALTRFLGLPSTVLYDRNPETDFSQYGGAVRFNYAPADDAQIIFQYIRGEQTDGRRFDQLIGGDGNLIADLRDLMLDFGYLRFIKQNLWIFDSGTFTASYNSQREERVNQGGQGNPSASVTHQYERTTAVGMNFFLDKRLPLGNTLLFGGDFYRERINSPAFTVDPVSGRSELSRPRVPDGARFDSGGIFVQNAWEAFPERLRVTGALRYGAAFYKARAADSPVVNGRRLWGDDSLRVADFSGRIGAVVRLWDEWRLALNYSRGFRYPSMTDLGTLGLTGDGFEVDHTAAAALQGTIGTTADADAVSTGIPVTKQRSEISHNFDAALRWTNRRFDTGLTLFRLDINDTIVKQALILPPGAVGRFLGDQPIISQLPNGVVFVPLSTAPVLVRANYTDAKLLGIEYTLEAAVTGDVRFKGNFTYVRAGDKQTGRPPNIEGGVPPATGFLSLKYAPAGRRFWIEAYSTLAARQDRLSTLDLGDRRTGAPRTRSQIANFFRRGACVRGLTNNPDGVCGTGDETVLLPTGETLAEVQDRVLGVGVNESRLFSYLPGYGLFNLRGGFRIGERSQVFWAFENIFDRFHRNPSWGIDGAGRSFNVAYRLKF